MPTPPPLAGPEAHRAAIHGAFRRSSVTAIMVSGGIYAAFSGSIFVNTDARWAQPLWAVTVVLGLLMAGTGWLLHRRAANDAVLRGAIATWGVVLLLHAGVFGWIEADLDIGYYFAILAAGYGAVLMPRPVLAGLHVAIGAVWILLVQQVGFATATTPSYTVAFGIAAGWGIDAMRTRLVVGRVQASLVSHGALQQSEERFRSLAETAKDGILLLDGDGKITYLNPAGLALFGLRGEDAVGRFLSQHLGAEATSPEALVGTREMSAQRRDGVVFPAELSLARTERDGKVAYTGVLRDITERHRVAQVRQQEVQREAEVNSLREMNEFKTRFLNMAAHELNTPLTPLRLQLHLLKTQQIGPLNERQAKAITVLDRNVLRLSGLVGELLEVARLQSQRLRLQVLPVGVDDAIDEVMESFGEAARRVGVTLDFAGQQNLVVLADRARTVQVLVNLISNALKFTPGGGRVTVEARDEGSHVRILIKDSGLGLSPEQQRRLFQPFSQVHDPMAITASGTGLGLYISKGLIEAMNGTIAVESAGKGQGSTFSFTLPAAEAGPVPLRAVRTVENDPIIRRLRELI